MEIRANKESLQPPLLLTSHGEQQTFYDVLENRFPTTTIPILHNKRVLASAYGWLVLVDDHHRNECCHRNPISMDIIQLPELEKAWEYDTRVLTKLPTEPDCYILFHSKIWIYRAYCRIGDNEFVSQTVEVDDDVEALGAVGSFQGKIYGIVERSLRCVTIHFVGKTDLEVRPIPITLRPWVTRNQDFLIESPCDSELLLVRRMLASAYIQDCCDFRVFRIDANRMECVELDNIGHRTIFVSVNGEGFCCSSTGTKPNCIYYMRGVTDCRNMYIYDLDDRSPTVLLPSPAVEPFLSVAFSVERNSCINLTNFS